MTYITVFVARKRLRDDDDRALMRYKEMYLQDGDLYSEGAGRIRNFRWKDVGEWRMFFLSIEMDSLHVWILHIRVM